MRVLFASAQLPGHLDWGGLLATAQACRRRGHDVLWVSGDAVAHQVTNAGVPFHAVAETGWRWPPPPPLTTADHTPDELVRQRQLRSLDQWLDVPRVRNAVAHLRPLFRQFRPDLAVAEMFMAGAGLTAEVEACPFVVGGWPAPHDGPLTGTAHPLGVESRTRLAGLLDALGIVGRNWTAHGPAALASPHLHISYFSPHWYGAHARHGMQTRYVGGTRPAPPSSPPAEWPAPDDAPWVLITLGTSFNRDPNFFAAGARAADAVGAWPLLVTGPQADHAAIRARLPQPLRDRVLMVPRVDFAAVLPTCAAALHHGGAGTTHALILHGVPQLVVPHAADQQRQAQGVARTGIGFHIAPHQATVENLTRGLAHILPDRSPCRMAAATLRAEFASLGGPERAVDRLEEVGK